MALTLNKISGLGDLTGDLKEFSATTGTPVIGSTTPIPNGSSERYLELSDTGTVASADLSLFSEVTNAGNGHVFGFAFQTGTIGVAAQTLVTVRDASNNLILTIEANASNFIRVLDASSSAVITGTDAISGVTWHYVELYFENLDSGDAELFLDRVSQGTTSASDFNAAGALTSIRFEQNSTSYDHFYDDFYWLSGATSSADRLGHTFTVRAYQSGAATATSDFNADGTRTTPDASDLGNWDQSGERTGSDANNCGFAASGALEGGVLLNDTNSGGAGPGPNSGTGPASDIEVVGASFWFRGDRTGGSGTTHTAFYGSAASTSVDADTVETAAITLLSGTVSDFFFGPIPASNAACPLSTEDFVLGVKKTSGGRDWDLREMAAQLAWSVPEADPIPVPLKGIPNNTLLRM